MIQLALRSTLDAVDGIGQSRTGLGRDVQGVRTAGVGPQIGEGDLLSSALLEKKFVLVVEEEDGKGTVKKTLIDVGHEMA